MDYKDMTLLKAMEIEKWTLNDGTPKRNNMHYCPNCGAKLEEAK